MKQELICQSCGRSFYTNRTRKYCSSHCSDMAQWKKRKAGLVKKTIKEKYVAKEYFDWREYPDTVII